MLHIIQNDPEVPPGNIVEHLTVPYIVHHPYNGDTLPAAAEIAALIVLGGAMGSNDDLKHPFLTDLKALIRDVVAAEVPYFGICLGGQLLASALGAAVVSHRWEELGTMGVFLSQEGRADHLFGGIPAEFTTFQWHHDSFDIPAGGIVLASSEVCPHQAFRVGRCAWGVQFHPEVTEAIIRAWCAWDDETLRKTEELVTAFKSESDSYLFTARQLVINFLRSSLLLPESC